MELQAYYYCISLLKATSEDIFEAMQYNSVLMICPKKLLLPIFRLGLVITEASIINLQNFTRQEFKKWMVSLPGRGRLDMGTNNTNWVGPKWLSDLEQQFFQNTHGLEGPPIKSPIHLF